MTTLNEVRKQNPIFFNNCKAMNKGNSSTVRFASSLYKSGCFITYETTKFTHGTEHSYKVWYVAEKGIRFLSKCDTIEEARKIAKEFVYKAT